MPAGPRSTRWASWSGPAAPCSTPPPGRSCLARVFTGGGHGCFIEAEGQRHFVYHRKLSVDPGWADREIRCEPFTWDAGGYPRLASQRNPADMQLGPESTEAASPTYDPGAVQMFGTRVPT